MDAPPDREDSHPFLDIASRLRSAGLNAPQVFHFDHELGFGLLEDFGDVLYRDELEPESAARLMPGLFDVLEGLAGRVHCDGLPDYDAQVLQVPDLLPQPELFPARCQRRNGGPGPECARP